MLSTSPAVRPTVCAGPSSSGAAAPSRRDVLQAVAATAVLLGAPAGPASAAGKGAAAQRPCAALLRPCTSVGRGGPACSTEHGGSDLFTGFESRHKVQTNLPTPSRPDPPGLRAAPKGFVPVQDLQDNYQFLYPFGWQEVSVKGADVVFKDVVEPLESVSVTLTSTDKKDILEFGDIQTVSAEHRPARSACHANHGRWQWRFHLGRAVFQPAVAACVHAEPPASSRPTPTRPGCPTTACCPPAGG